MSGALRELLVAFGFEVDSTPLDHAQKQVAGFVDSLKSVAKVAAEAFAIREITGFVGEMIRAGSEINDTADRLGVTTDALQEFQFAAKLSGVQSEEAAHALQFLNKNLGDAAAGNADAAQTFRELGVDLESVRSGSVSATDLLPQLADKFSSAKSSAEQTAIAMKIFGRSGATLIPLLKTGSKGLQELRERFKQIGGGLNKDFIENADRAGDQIDTFKFALRGLASTFVVSILPTLTDWVGKMATAVGWLRQTAEKSNIVKSALLVLAGVGAVLAAEFIIAELPIILFVAALALLALGIDDVVTMFQGGKSVTGEFIDSLFGVGASAKFVAEVKKEVSGLYDTFLALWPVVKTIGGLISDVFSAAAPYVAAFWKNALDSQAKWLQFAVAAIKKTADLLGMLFQAWGGVGGKIGELLHLDAAKEFGDKLKMAGAQLSLAATTDPSASPEASGSDLGMYRTNVHGDTNVSNTNNVNITMNGGANGVDNARLIGGAVKKALTQSDLNAAHAALKKTGAED